jgi:hypothetical protein
MPNWCYSSLILTGAKDEILRFTQFAASPGRAPSKFSKRHKTIEGESVLAILG